MKKIIVFGAGSASLYPILGLNQDNYEIEAVIDNDVKKNGKEWLGYIVESPQNITNHEFDFVVISHIYGKEARKQLEILGVSNDKIIDFYEKLEMFYDVRIAMLKTCALEIERKNIPGALAEVGVYQGEFSKHFNELFPNKKLHLFDTFEGFDAKDISEQEKAISNPNENEFTDTNVELVLSKMKHPEMVEVHKGYFPDSINGLEECFSLVSLDPDLYQPVLNGLLYFYPRLSKGGYIFIHDYNNRRFSGVKKAVDDFCCGKNIQMVPICDIGGTVVITK